MSECVVQWVNFLGTSSKTYSCGSKFYRATYANSIADDSISSVTTYKLWTNKKLVVGWSISVYHHYTYLHRASWYL